MFITTYIHILPIILNQKPQLRFLDVRNEKIHYGVSIYYHYWAFVNVCIISMKIIAVSTVVRAKMKMLIVRCGAYKSQSHKEIVTLGF